MGGFGKASANTRQLLSTEPVHHAPPAKAGIHLHKAMAVLRDGADALCALPQRVGAHGGQQGIGYLRRADSYQLAFVGHVQRVQAQQFAGGLHLGNTGMAASSITIPT